MKASEINQVVIESTGEASGRVIRNEQLSRVRVNEDSYRKAKDGQTVRSIIDWITDNGLKFSDRIVTGTIGTVTIKKFYTREIA